MTDEYQIDGTTHAEKDANGDIVHKPDVVNTGQHNNTEYVPTDATTGAEINSVISSVSDGTEVVIPAGTYTLSEAVSDQNKNNIHLRGQGKGATTLKVADSTQINAINLTEVTGWTIEALEIDGAGSTQSDAGTNNNQCGVCVDSCDRTKVRDCWIHDTYLANIRYASVSSSLADGWILNNYLDTTYAPDESDHASNNVSVTGEAKDALEGVLVRGNKCFNAVRYGIEFSGGASDCAAVNNSVYNSGQPALASQGTFNARNRQYIGNYIEGAGGSAIEATAPNALIANNQIQGGSYRGIDVLGGAADSLVIGNVVDGCTSQGIRSGEPGIPIIGNTVINTGDHAIQTNNTDMMVLGNYCSPSTGWAIRIPGNECVAAFNVVESNPVRFEIGATDNEAWGNSRIDSGSIVSDQGTRNLINGVGSESANAETPSSSWSIGSVVDFTDSGDGSGTGVYHLLPDGSWYAT